VVAPPSTASQRLKHGRLEDGNNKRWQAIVNFGKWITTDESRVAGWYHSVMTIGPEPKPIRTGATLHTVCVTHGPLSTYKLFARVYTEVNMMKISIDIIKILLLNSRWYHCMISCLILSSIMGTVLSSQDQSIDLCCLGRQQLRKDSF
jgi:hypothetical protein